jgi:hypothetical protein
MSEPDSQPKLPPVTPEAEEAGREQLAEYFGFAQHATITVGGETFTVTNENLLSEEQQEALDEVQAELRTFDHETVVIRNAITNEVVIDPKTGEPLTERVLIEPHMKGGELVKPNYWARRVKANLGEEAAKRYFELGGRSSEFRLTLSRMQREFMKRVADDSKSG